MRGGTDAGKGRRRDIAYVLGVAVAAACLGVIACVLYGYWQGQHTYEQVQQTALPGQTVEVLEEEASKPDGAAPEGGRPADMEVDWEALLAVNADTVGWVYMPDTPINYLVVHSHDNNEYLYINFNGEYGNGLQPTYGTPFLLAENAGDFTDAVNFIQGHDMANGTMFAEIPKLGADSEKFNAHRTVYLLTPTRNFRLRTIALVECESDDTSVVRTQFGSLEDLQAYAADLMGRSIVEVDSADVAPEDIGKLVVLSTCTADGTDRRSLLVCAVAEWAEPGGETYGALGNAKDDESAASEIEDAAAKW